MSCIVAFIPLSARSTSSVWLVQPENIFVRNGVFKIGDMVAAGYCRQGLSRGSWTCARSKQETVTADAMSYVEAV